MASEKDENKAQRTFFPLWMRNAAKYEQAEEILPGLVLFFAVS